VSEPARFLERWSRLKRNSESATAPAAEGPAAPAPARDPTLQPAPAVPGEAAGETPLPPIESLDLNADFTAFLKEEVSETLRRAALRKLFSDPHFNRMDGLDIYIDDYSVSDPIPPEMLKKLRQFKTFLEDAEAAAPDAALLPEPAAAQSALPVAGAVPDSADPNATPRHGPPDAPEAGLRPPNEAASPLAREDSAGPTESSDPATKGDNLGH
jgi:hypothetical protein